MRKNNKWLSDPEVLSLRHFSSSYLCTFVYASVHVWMSVCVFCPQKMTSDTLLAPVNHLHTHTLTNVMICGVITRKCQFHAPLYMKTFMGLLFPYQLLVTVLPVCNGWHETLHTNTQTQLHTKTKHDLCRRHQNTQRGS